jgi:hypothetical protein
MSADLESIWDTLLIVFSGFEGWFCVFSGFIDETEKHEGKRLTGVGGFLFRKEAMSAVQADIANRTKGLKKPFHAAHCNAQRGEFSGWDYDKCQELLSDIAGIIAKHRGIGVLCAVDNEDFEKWKDKQPHKAEWFGYPYSVCLFAALDIARKYLDDQGDNNDIFYIIEGGATGRKQGEDFLRRIQAKSDLRERFRLRSYAFISKEDPDGLLLCSSDLLVWSWQRNHLETERSIESGGQDDILCTPFRRLFVDENTPPICYTHLNAKGLSHETLRVTLLGIISD